MKWIKALMFCLLMVLFTGTAWARPVLVCDPQADALGYSGSYDQAVWVDVPYQEFDLGGGDIVALVADLSDQPSDVNLTIYVKAFGEYAPELGRRLESAVVPFDFFLHSDTGVYISTPTGFRIVDIPD